MRICNLRRVALLGAYFVVGGVLAMPADAFAAQDWEVLVVDESGSAKICGIGRRFEDGSGLVLAGRKGQINHVTIEAANSTAFEQGVNYKVHYIIGNAMRGAFDARSANGKALVAIKAGAIDILPALAKSATVEFKIETAKAGTLKFPLSGFGLALGAYRDCFGGGDVTMIPAPVIENPKQDAVIPSPPREMQNLDGVEGQDDIKQHSSQKPVPRPRYTEKLQQELRSGVVSVGSNKDVPRPQKKPAAVKAKAAAASKSTSRPNARNDKTKTAPRTSPSDERPIPKPPKPGFLGPRTTLDLDH